MAPRCLFGSSADIGVAISSRICSTRDAVSAAPGASFRAAVKKDFPFLFSLYPADPIAEQNRLNAFRLTSLPLPATVSLQTDPKPMPRPPKD